MDAAVRAHLLRQRVDVGGLELGLLAVLDQERRQAVPARRELAQHVGVGGGSPGLGGAAQHRQAAALEQHVCELLRRVDVERPARLGVDLALQLGQRGNQAPVELLEHRGVEADPVPLHLLEHGHQRQLDGREDPLEALLLEALVQERRQRGDRARTLVRRLLAAGGGTPRRRLSAPSSTLSPGASR